MPTPAEIEAAMTDAPPIEWIDAKELAALRAPMFLIGVAATLAIIFIGMVVWRISMGAPT